MAPEQPEQVITCEEVGVSGGAGLPREGVGTYDDELVGGLQGGVSHAWRSWASESLPLPFDLMELERLRELGGWRELMGGGQELSARFGSLPSPVDSLCSLGLISDKRVRR